MKFSMIYVNREDEKKLYLNPMVLENDLLHQRLTITHIPVIDTVRIVFISQKANFSMSLLYQIAGQFIEKKLYLNPMVLENDAIMLLGQFSRKFAADIFRHPDPPLL